MKASVRKLLFWLYGRHKEKAQLWLVCFQIYGIYWPLIKTSWQNTDYEPSDTFLSMGGLRLRPGGKEILESRLNSVHSSQSFKWASEQALQICQALCLLREKKERKRQTHSSHVCISPVQRSAPAHADCNVGLTARSQGKPSTLLNIWLQDFLSSSTPFCALNSMSYNTAREAVKNKGQINC